VYIADAGHNTLRKVASDGTISTIAGTGFCCYSGDGGPAISAALNAPWGAAVDAVGNIFFTDYGNNAVRAIGSASGTPSIGTVANGASNQQGAIAPGELVVVFGAGLGPGLGPGQLAQAGGSAVTQLAGVSVLFNGVPGQMLYADSGQVSAVAPADLSGPSVQVVVTSRSFASNAVPAPLAAASPAVFTADSSGAGQAAARNQDGSINGTANAATVGSTLTLLATGTASFQPSVTIAGMASTVTSVTGVAPGVIAIAVRVPSGLHTGAVPVLIGAGGVSSPAGVTVALR
jgi:uncharacterized protein (TIGR03437 family)